MSPLLAGAILLLSPLFLTPQTTLDRSILVSGGGFTGNGGYIVGGSLTQTAAGLVGAGEQTTTAGLGFWFRGRIVAGATIRIPTIEAEPGTRLMIPVILENPKRLLRYGPRTFRLRLRYNRSLLEPENLTCTLDDGDCLLEFTGEVSGNLRDTIARIPFLAMLGNAESTPLTIDTVIWQTRGESRFDAQTIDGQFNLLGICREGGEIRLIHGGGPGARLTVTPNIITTGEATLGFVTAASVPTRIAIIDELGREQRLLVDQSVEAARLYREPLDLRGLPSGAYFVVMQSGADRRIEPIRIRE